jgi:ring-1,2-phenylacetyl-CoA epoxidase subunit PaaE
VSWHPLRIDRVERLCDDAVALTLTPRAEERCRFDFVPGQHLVVRRPGSRAEARRTYSLCSAPGDPLRIGVRRVAAGEVSGWLVDRARVGDVVEAQPPTGRFTLGQTAAGEHHVLVAAGSGITPVLSIATTLLRDRGATASLVLANRSSATAMFTDAVADLKDRWPDRLSVLHVLSREPRDSGLLSGRLDAARFAALLDALVPWQRASAFWLCGPWTMVQAHRDVLEARGVHRDRVRSELFFVEDVPPPPPPAPVEGGPSVTMTVTLEGRTTEVPLAAGSVLDAVRAARAEVPFACRGGVCGTCRALVVSGEVDMQRNFALEDDEVARGYVLTCQSYVHGPGVVVDYDA